MGFLDDLKRQAEATRAAQEDNAESLARTAELTDAACHAAFRYLTTLAQQLNVLKRRSKATYRLDRRQSFDDLVLTDFRVDSRKRNLRGTEVYDHLVLRWTLRSGQRCVLTKNFPPDIEQLENRLRRAGIQADVENLRHPETGKLLEVRYAFMADFAGEAVITPDHDQGTVRIELLNIDDFEKCVAEFPAFDLDTPRLDDFARWLLGEPNRFLVGARQLRRMAA